jgi:hypothetical protein
MLSRLVAGALLLFACATASAGLPTFCDRADKVTATDQDRVLRFAAAVKDELARSGSSVALVARAGLDLHRFGLLYSHAGIALKDNPGGPWAVRQLYYACDESRPLLFDQGMSGFVLGADAPTHGHVALLFPPAEDGALLERAALDKPLALSLLGDRYSANAYAFGIRYQNCNQWVAELLAFAWGGLDAAAPTSHASLTSHARTQAQAWLRARDYAAAPVRVPSHLLMFAGQFVPFVHVNDHPLDDVYALALHVSVPTVLEDFVHREAPQTRRVELCHDERRIVVHRGWEALGADCTPLPGDEVIALAP